MKMPRVLAHSAAVAQSSTLIFAVTLLSGAVVPTLAGQRPGLLGKTVVVVSPDRTVRAELQSRSGLLTYRVEVDGKQVLAPSRLGIFSDNIELGTEVTLGTETVRHVDERYPFHGAHATAHNNAVEATVPATSHGVSYMVDLHVANDGVAVRLRLPAAPDRKIQADRTAWKLDGDPVLWVDRWDPAYEGTYKTTSLSLLGEAPLGLPLTARIGTLYATFTEAALRDYGDLGIKPAPDGTLQGELFNDPQGWTTSGPVVQPWRVMVIARNLTALVNTTLVQSLNAPPTPQMARARWIRPGRSTWQWLAIGEPRRQDQPQWVDWTRQLGYEYYLIDDGWSAWNDPWRAIASVAAYAKQRNVRIWIWVHSKEVTEPAARNAYFQQAAQVGVAGIKIDFPPPTDRWWSTWYWDTARDAAAFHLMVDFHGATKPTGMERTWPNALTREGVRGHEYQITRYNRRLEDAHDTILPFTRFVVGPGDYTPTVFEAKELQGDTWGHELAQAVIFTSPFLSFGGHPESYFSNPARDVLRVIPAVWDETRVLDGSEPGKVVAEARRSGKQWFIAVINGGEASSLDVSLSFLGKGNWEAAELFDNPAKPDSWIRKAATVGPSDHIRLDLSSRGGFVAWIKKPGMAHAPTLPVNP